jgi:uncharacterized protein YegJ (DUF2314 family)
MPEDPDENILAFRRDRTRFGTGATKGMMGSVGATTMSKASTTLNVIALLAIAAYFASPDAQTISEKAQRDDIVNVSKDDPTMLAAMRKGRSTLSSFLTLSQAPEPKMEGFSVKVAVRDHGQVEYFWITPFERKDGQFSGAINNRPRSVRNVSFGQTITFAENEIVDWMYMDDGKMKGSYTTCAILKKEPRAEADAMMKQYGLACDM